MKTLHECSEDALPAPPPRLLRYRATALLARTADEGMGVATALLALERTGSPATGGLVMAAWMAPHVLAAPLAGWAAERAARPRPFYALALAGFAGAIGALALLVGRAPLGLVLLAAVLGGGCGPMVTGGLSSLLAGLVRQPDHRARAYGQDAVTYTVAGVVGPAIAAGVASAGSAALATATLATAAAAAAAMVLTLPLRTARRDRPTAAHSATAHSATARGAGGLGAGVRALLRVPELRTITLASSVAAFGTAGVTLTAVLLADRMGAPDGGGLLVTLWALGSVVSASAVAYRPPRTPPATLARWSLVATGGPLAAAALASSFTPSFALCVVLFALAGAGNGPLLSATLRIRADHAPPEVRTQVFTIGAGVKITAAAAGAALTAASAEHLPLGALLLGLAAVQGIAAVLLWPGRVGTARRASAPRPVGTA